MSREIDRRSLAGPKNVSIKLREQGAAGLTAPKGMFLQRALEQVRSLGGAMGLTAAQPPEFVADPHVMATSSGAVAVHLQQQFKGIPIFQAAQAVRFGPDGTLQETAGASVPVAGDLEIAVKVSVEQAILIAARHVAQPSEDEQAGKDQFGRPLRATAWSLDKFAPVVIAAFRNLPLQPTVVDGGPFGSPIKASLGGSPSSACTSRGTSWSRSPKWRASTGRSSTVRMGRSST